ncbi:hypothetical protein ACKWTF_012006 [Chironomus riparius]
MERVIRDSVSKMSSTLQTRAQKFNELFKTLLQQSKEGFHQMFKQTYGVIYEQNSYVFNDLFVMLEGYFLRGKLDLTEMMDKFFNQLYQKMFTVINRQYEFNDEYLACVSERMKDLKPFGDVPDKLSVQVKRSFVATRTFVQALSSAADVAKNMMTIRHINECTASLTKMSVCGTCGGHKEKPCEAYCINVMKGCLQQYAELDTEWDNFVIQMEKVSDRLLGPFNIVMVVEPINIKISEAIMNFQESGSDISKRIYSGCGTPRLGRNADLSFDDEHSKEIPRPNERVKRLAEPGNQPNRGGRNQEINVEPMKFPRNDYQANRGSNRGRSNNSNRNIQRGQYTGKTDSRESALDKLVKEIRQKVKDTKKFWSNLPYTACNNDDFTPSRDNDVCWNGVGINRYIPSKSNDTMPTRQSQIVAQQLFTLKTTINHLKNAYNGNDVEWPDNDDGSEESGSGSGSGIDDEDDDDGSGIQIVDPESPVTFSTETPPSGTRPSNNNNNIDLNTNNNDMNFNTIDETKEDSDPDIDETREAKTSTASSSWKTKRLIFTYFLPIVMAWFGGSISNAITELL